MSEIEMKIEVDEPAIEKKFEPAVAKKFANAQTQHGREETAEEENIVVLAITRSPVREESDEVVWHEDTEEVSSAFIFIIAARTLLRRRYQVSNYFLLQSEQRD